MGFMLKVNLGQDQLNLWVMSSGKLILGILAGIAAGAIAGILFAPDKGSSTRKKMVNKGEDYVDQLKARINEHMHDGSKRKEKVSESPA
jgi:gas vesicle protein